MTSSVPSKAARKQSELCVALVREMESAMNAGHPVDRALRNYYRAHAEFGSRDRRFFSALVFAWFRWRGWLEQPDARNCALAYCLDALEDHPAITILSGMVGINPQPIGRLELEEKARMLGVWLNRPAPALASLVPEWTLPTLACPVETTNASYFSKCLSAFQTRPPTWFRSLSIGTSLSSESVDLQVAWDERLVGAGYSYKSIDMAGKAARRQLALQDLASQCVGLVCAPKPGQHWWDACAGAGGKSLHLAALMQGRGSVLATDIRRSIRENMQKRIDGRPHTDGITIRNWDGETDVAPGQKFDGVLVDAPCSGLGTWGRNPDARWRTTGADIERYAQIQCKLMRQCADKVRPGGRLVYAVCTLTEAETLRVTRNWLAENTDFRAWPVQHPLTKASTSGLMWILPWDGPCNGMFIAVFERRA